MHTIFFRRRSGSQASLLVLFCILYVLHEQLHFCVDQFGKNNVVISTLRLLMNCIIPYGRSRWFFKNANAVGRTWALLMAKIFPEFDALQLTLFSYVWSLFGFVFFRVCVGSMYMNSLRWRLTINNSGDAFFMYATGILQPFEVVFSMTFGSERFISTRFTYGVVAIILSYYELSYAFGFFIIRVLISIADYSAGFRYGRQLRHLYANVDYMGRVFRQNGSMPDISLERLNILRKAVKKVQVKALGEVQQGTAFLRRVGNKFYLFTVNHLVAGSQEISYGISKMFATPYVTNLDDPVVGVPVCLRASEECDAVAILDLSESDAPHVVYLVSMQLDDDLQVKMSIIPRFSYDKREKRFIVQSDYIEGDSGSPVFAVMPKGEIYYCGAVSAGNPDEKAGNIASALLRTKSRAESVPITQELQPDKLVIGVDGFIKERALTDVVKYLNEINDLMLVGDPSYGWREMTEEEFHDQYDDTPTHDVQIDSDDEDKDNARKKKSRWKRKARNAYQDYKIKRIVVDRKIAALEAAAGVAYGSTGVRAIMARLNKFKGRYPIKPGHILNVTSDGYIIEDDNPGAQYVPACQLNVPKFNP